jgi:taurine dioxygenase
VESIRQALFTHRVLFFRDQTQLNDTEQEGFARLLGNLVAHPTERVRENTAAVFELDAAAGHGRANQWHTDMTFVDAYPRYSVLRAVTVPPYGGDTIWASTVGAYNDLSPALKQLADTLWALHSNKFYLLDYSDSQHVTVAETNSHYKRVFASSLYECRHPVVRVHPQTGEKSLLLGYFVQRIVGHNHADSNFLYELLQSHVQRPENTVRWSWRQHDVAIWDNQATQHYAVNDYDGQDRTMRRVTIAGEVPVSTEGLRSQMIVSPLVGH